MLKNAVNIQVFKSRYYQFCIIEISFTKKMQKKMFCCKKKCQKVSKEEQGSLSCHKFRQGGTSTIPQNSITKYASGLHNNLKEKQDLLPSIQRLHEKILNDPVLRMSFNEGSLSAMRIHSDPDENGNEFRLLGDSIEHAMQVINAAATSAPRFQNQDITGVPIYALFLDYLQSPWGQQFFTHKQVNDSLKEIFDDYSNNILKTEKSLEYMSEWVYGPALKFWNPIQYKIPDINNPLTMGFKCWEDFFLRQFKEGVRPLEGPVQGSMVRDQDIITTVCESYPLVSPAMPVTNVKLIDQFWLKDNKYSLFDMFDANERKTGDYAKLFEDGTVYQAFLDPWAYHHWHSPVDGVIEKEYLIEGGYYLQNPGILDPNTDDEYVNSQPFLSCVSTRRVFLIKADNQKIGYIAIIFIGMGEVSSCVATKKTGERVKKGQKIGHFEFGGSSHAVLFQKDCILDFSRNVQKAYYMDPKTNQMFSRKINLRKELATVRNVMTHAEFKKYKENNHQ